jgi:acetoin utilization deacetylase AcuC-like enzyme
MRLFYDPDYALAGASFDTTRKSLWLAESLVAEPIESITLERPARITRDLLRLVHDAEYLDALETGAPKRLAESAGFEWDEGLWRSVHAHTSGVVAAAFAALEDGVSGTLSSGLHHARHYHGLGFCALNGLAVAAHAVRQAGVKRILVLDLDAHCGGGTNEALGALEGVRQIDLVPTRNRYFDDYIPTRGRLLTFDEPGEYLPLLKEALADEETPELVLYNAGMDVHDGCRLGGMGGIFDELIRAREELVFAWARERGVPIAFALAGGYTGVRMTREHLVTLHRLTIAAAAGAA